MNNDSIIKDVIENAKIKKYQKIKTKNVDEIQCYSNKCIKMCPSCKVQTYKANGCNQMTCIFCGYHWRWMCGSNCPSKN